jgi:hypothetical protein
MNIVLLVRAYEKRKAGEEREGGDENLDANNANENDSFHTNDEGAHNPQKVGSLERDTSFDVADGEADNSLNGMGPIKGRQVTWDDQHAVAILAFVDEAPLEEVIQA